MLEDWIVQCELSALGRWFVEAMASLLWPTGREGVQKVGPYGDSARRGWYWHRDIEFL